MQITGLPIGLAFKNASARATEWNSASSLCLIIAVEWDMYTEAVKIDVDHWRFTFVAPSSETVSYDVSEKGVVETERGKAQYGHRLDVQFDIARSLSRAAAVASTQVDANNAVKRAETMGFILITPPELRTYLVRGRPVPLWKIQTGTSPLRGVLVHAATGAIVPWTDAEPVSISGGAASQGQLPIPTPAPQTPKISTDSAAATPLPVSKKPWWKFW